MLVESRQVTALGSPGLSRVASPIHKINFFLAGEKFCNLAGFFEKNYSPGRSWLGKMWVFDPGNSRSTLPGIALPRQRCLNEVNTVA